MARFSGRSTRASLALGINGEEVPEPPCKPGSAAPVAGRPPRATGDVITPTCFSLRWHTGGAGGQIATENGQSLASTLLAQNGPEAGD